MKRFYGFLAYLIALAVVVQAMAIVFGIAGLRKWIENGGVADKATLESSDKPFPEVLGLAVHGMSGMMVIPAIALILLVISFFAKVDGGVKMAVIVVVLVAVQVMLGMALVNVPALGALHGLNAFLVLGAALHAGMRSRRPSTGVAEAQLPAEVHA